MIVTTADCECHGKTQCEVLGRNSVGKPVVRCRDCGERGTAPLDAVETPPGAWTRDRDQLATDGGGC